MNEVSPSEISPLPAAPVSKRWPVRDSLYTRLGKRVFDIAGASIALVIFAPAIIAINVGIRLTLGRGVLYRQLRVGHNGQDFEILKFRTMRHSRRRTQVAFDGPDRRTTHKHDLDPRHTSIGRTLRRTGLDELPQLVNVMRGEMSLVGPRPELASVVDRYGLRSHPREQVRPGITGPWQTTGRNDGRMLHECFDDDLEYVTNLTFRTDLTILVRTARQVVLSKGN